MKIFISVKPGSKEEKVEKIDENHFQVAVKEPPVQGRANQAIIKSLAQFFNISPFSVKIISGWTSRQKIVEIQK
ncbi:MAG: DUF167 domain-containing protein [bacterium]|nr:DUF167 domain-containing protein [bacterium]